MTNSNEGDASRGAKGTRLGNYVLGDRLAAGGMAELFSASSLGRHYEAPIVLKRMLPHLANNRSFVDMFIDEARITTRLEHPNIVQVHDFEATDSGLCLVMELVDGPDVLAILKRCLETNTRMPIELAAYIACHVLEALDYAHRVTANGRRLDIVHRDVSPSNILISRRGHVKLADFGIARAAERQHATATGTLKGKYAYMSPEQILGRNLDGRSDVFSAAIVLTELLIARRLFAAAGDLDVLLMVRRADVSRLDKHGTHIPAELQAIIRRALSRDREQRFASAGEFRDALADWLASSEHRTGAAQLAAFIRSLEEQGGCLCKWQARASQAATSPTLSGTETQLARVALKKSARIGRQVFALGAAPTNAASASGSIVDDMTLEPYDGASVEPQPLPAAHDKREPEPETPPPAPAAAAASGPAQRAAEGMPFTGGSLEEVGALDLLCAIAHRRLTGLLVLKSGAMVKEAYFREGHPEFVRSNLPDERFGQFLVRLGVLTPKDLARVVAALPHFDGRMGQALVGLGLLKPVDAVHLLAEQVAHKLIDACAMPRGDFWFRPGVRNPWPALALHLNTFEIVGRSLSAMQSQPLATWAGQHSKERPAVDIRMLREFGFDAELQQELSSLRGNQTLEVASEAVPPTVNRMCFLAATYVVWRCGVIRFHPPLIDLPPASPPERAVVFRSAKRKFPRVPVRCDGSMELCRRAGRQTVLVEICSATCEGLGVRVIGKEHRGLRRGEQILLRFNNGQQELEIPGQIAWSVEKRDAGFDLGLKLQLALAESVMREAYASWVVELIANASKARD